MKAESESAKFTYIVTSDGQVWSKTNWRGYGTRRLLPTYDRDGYQCVRLATGGNRRMKLRVHRLVASLFLPPQPTPKHEIRHLDGTRTNNHYSNLRWGTTRENAQDRENHARARAALRAAEGA